MKQAPKRSHGLKIILLLTGAALLAGLVALAGYLLLRTQPRPVVKTLFEGITYERQVRQTPRRMVVHIVRIDLRTPGLQILVTPCDPEAELSCPARTTSEFLVDFDLQLAINGDSFTPWSANTLLDYYPHSGDPVEPTGMAASGGTQYADFTDSEPVLYISRTNQARFNSPPGKLYNAISGNLMLVEQGRALSLPDSSPEPRSAVGMDKQGKFLVLVVVDGRQPGYSMGARLDELAVILIDAQVQYGMNLDGGGSATLVRRSPLGLTARLNSPVNHGIPGLERPVANHLGVYAPAP